MSCSFEAELTDGEHPLSSSRERGRRSDLSRKFLMLNKRPSLTDCWKTTQTHSDTHRTLHFRHFRCLQWILIHHEIPSWGWQGPQTYSQCHNELTLATRRSSGPATDGMPPTEPISIMESVWNYIKRKKPFRPKKCKELWPKDARIELLVSWEIVPSCTQDTSHQTLIWSCLFPLTALCKKLIAE